MTSLLLAVNLCKAEYINILLPCIYIYFILPDTIAAMDVVVEGVGEHTHTPQMD